VTVSASSGEALAFSFVLSEASTYYCFFDVFINDVKVYMSFDVGKLDIHD